MSFMLKARQIMEQWWPVKIDIRRCVLPGRCKNFYVEVVCQREMNVHSKKTVSVAPKTF